MMKNLWFKQCYVAPILSGEKPDTIRRDSDRLPAAGESVSFSVGPRPPFAVAEIVKRELIDLSALTEARRREVLGIYSDEPGPFARLTFQVLYTPRQS